MKKQIFTLSTLAILLAACGEARHSTPSKNIPETATQSAPAATETHAASSVTPDASVMAAAAASIVAQATTTPNTSTTPATASAPTTITTHQLPSHRPFVITADLTFRTEDVRKTAVAIEQLAIKHGGFVMKNQTNSHILHSQQFEQSDGMLLIIDNFSSQADLTVRVPRQNAQAFLHDVQPYIQLLENQQFSAEDVATLLQRQLLAAEREQQRNKDLQAINAQPKIAPSDRRATIEAQYAAREQADEAKIQQTELQDKIQFATIHLHFRQPEQIVKHTTPNPRAVAQAHRPDFWASVKVAMMRSWQFLLSAVLFLLEIWYVFVAIALFLRWQHLRANRVQENHDFEVEELHEEEAEEDNTEESPPRHISRRRKKFQHKQYTNNE